jgi:type VI secretion system VasD/TssJ family lipoprotein
MRRVWRGALFALLLIVSCAKVPIVGKSSDIEIEVAADPNCNSCGNPNGNPLMLRVLQVTDASSLAGLSLVQLWDYEEARLGDGLVEKREATVEPGAKKVLMTKRQAKATTVVLVGNFCRTEGRCWYLTRTLPEGSGISFKVRAQQFCLTEPR